MLSKTYLSCTLLSVCLSLHGNALANPQDLSHVIIMPNCLVKSTPSNLKQDMHALTSTPDFSLMRIPASRLDDLAEAKHQAKPGCGGFRDVTEQWLSHKPSGQFTRRQINQFLQNELTRKVPHKHGYEMKYPTQVNQLLPKVNPDNMWAKLTTLTNFQDRYGNSDNGVKAAQWIKSEIETLAKATGHQDVTVQLIPTRNYKQPSVVAKFGNSDEPGIVIGGHMDTLSSRYENKPGADDDGTGTVTVMEAAKVLLESGMQFKKPIYFMWYAVEELGLIGSNTVAGQFKSKNIPLTAVIQFDMTGYRYNNDPTIWLLSDYVNKDLTTFLSKLISNYIKQPVSYTRCGYACSDHASWHQRGYAAAMPFEAAFGQDNPYIHTSNDKMEYLSLPHMTSFAKLAVAFAVELAEPIV